MQKEKVMSLLIGHDYYSKDDLRYNVKYGFMFTKEQMDEFLMIKRELLAENFEFLHKIPLITFNSKYCYYANGLYLTEKMTHYLRSLIDDYNQNNNFLLERNFNDILLSRVFSEIEGTLSIENVPTTRKKIEEIFRSDSLTDKNDVIIKNMINAINFILFEKPEFNKTNLYKLYNLLSSGCLDEEDKLQKNNFYRHDDVFVGGFNGAPVDMIDKMMNSLFEFVNNIDNQRKYDSLLPHICHYYILYVHPYFDYNGRTARMVSFWLSFILDIPESPYFISEAINEHKRDYYRAIANSRVMENDITYFLGFIMDSSIKFCYLYRNIEEIKKALSKNGDTLTSTETLYIKKILIHNPYDVFNYKMFLEYINGTMSKQGTLKMLNSLAEQKLLIKSKNKRGENIYRFNQDFITYKYE